MRTRPHSDQLNLGSDSTSLREPCEVRPLPDVLPDIEELLSDAPVLAAALSRLARGEAEDMTTDLAVVEIDIQVPGTLTKTHCYSLALDGMGWPRVGLLIQRICERVVDYAIPRKVIQEAHEHYLRTKQTNRMAWVVREARSLFTHLVNSGEGGELLLFCLAESVLGYPQILCKMYLKTSTEMHYHGADGAHASADPVTGQLCVWWGESKLHKSPKGAIKSCLTSIAPLLIEPQTSESRRARDLQLIRHNIDLDDLGLETALKRYLDTSDPLYNRTKYGGLALVGFDHGCYPAHPQKAIADEITVAVKSELEGWRKHCATRISAEGLHEVDVHLFLIPFPSVKAFRDRLRKELGLA